jgi:hypothetical protein
MAMARSAFAPLAAAACARFAADKAEPSVAGAKLAAMTQYRRVRLACLARDVTHLAANEMAAAVT